MVFMLEELPVSPYFIIVMLYLEGNKCIISKIFINRKCETTGTNPKMCVKECVVAFRRPERTDTLMWG